MCLSVRIGTQQSAGAGHKRADPILMRHRCPTLEAVACVAGAGRVTKSHSCLDEVRWRSQTDGHVADRFLYQEFKPVQCGIDSAETDVEQTERGVRPRPRPAGRRETWPVRSTRRPGPTQLELALTGDAEPAARDLAARETSCCSFLHAALAAGCRPIDSRRVIR
ncbi:hypothetical protein [Nocardia grenadensis]|uniref:hypothetical protein n=1 Tax=Nocardia grenadensis TaxID=931537 RepID=UPI003D75B4AF